MLIPIQHIFAKIGHFAIVRAKKSLNMGGFRSGTPFALIPSSQVSNEKEDPHDNEVLIKIVQMSL